MELPDYAERLESARSFLASRIRRTPVEFSQTLSDLLGSPVWLKLEMLQETGSFKIRGAFLRLAELAGSAGPTGVATCSAGNHGWALAYAGRRLGVPVSVYLPASVDEAKLRGIQALGAQVIITPYSGFDEAEEHALEESRRRGIPFVSAFDDDAVILGNGATIAAEILEEIPEATTFAVPVGGGGLAAGLSLHLRFTGRPFRLVACQLQQSPALQLSMARGHAVTRMPPIETMAGGLEGGIGKRTFEILRHSVQEVCLLTEEELRRAVLWLLFELRYLVEPSGAAGVAACLGGLRTSAEEGAAVVVVTGRNISEGRLRALLE